MQWWTLVEWGEIVYVISMQLIKAVVCLAARRYSFAVENVWPDIPRDSGWRGWRWLRVLTGLLRNGLMKNTPLDKMYSTVLTLVTAGFSGKNNNWFFSIANSLFAIVSSLMFCELWFWTLCVSDSLSRPVSETKWRTLVLSARLKNSNQAMIIG